MSNEIETVKESMPMWHFAMLGDIERNYAIESAIRSLNLEGKTIFEIGAGAGLISMLFAKHGAKRVIACEMNSSMAEIASQTIAANGYADRVEIIAKESRQVLEDGDIQEAPDVIFTETLDCGVIGEGFLAIAEDIKKLATPETCVLPQAIRQFGILCSDPLTYGQNTVRSQNSLDLSKLNCHSIRTYYRTGRYAHQRLPLSPLMLIRDFNYLKSTQNEPITLEVIALRSELCHGMVSFFDALFGNFVVSSRSEMSHWSLAFHPLDVPIRLERDHVYQLTFLPDGHIDIEPT